MSKPETTDELIDSAQEELRLLATRKVAASLKDEDGILDIFMRFDNNRVEYSVRRADPTLSGVDDATLMAAILVAGGRYEFRRRKRLEARQRASAFRSNGDAIVFKDKVSIDFENEILRSTRGKPITLQALSIVVRDLSASAAEAAQPSTPPEPAN